jgi:hypothetical protein
MPSAIELRVGVRYRRPGGEDCINEQPSCLLMMRQILSSIRRLRVGDAIVFERDGGEWETILQEKQARMQVAGTLGVLVARALTEAQVRLAFLRHVKLE